MFFFKDEKDEVIATNVWIRQVTTIQGNRQYIWSLWKLFETFFAHILRSFFSLVNKFLVSKESVVLPQWESETWKLGSIRRVDKGRITAVDNLKSDR